MCGDVGTSQEDYCSGSLCPRRASVAVRQSNAVQKYNVEQRMNGEPHCCVNFFPFHLTQPFYIVPANPLTPVKPVGGGECICSDVDHGFFYVVKVRGAIYPGLR